ncbi:hypothetical protein [Streptomyces sp. 058-1L]|uniref:hypothetical protein n=1 Tax=Streptomyces sp. 058-1L TaxID=2789266 RepID=UPI00397EED14
MNLLRMSRNCFSVGCRGGEAETWGLTGVVDVDEAVWVPQAVRARELAAAMTTDAVKRIDGIGESLPRTHVGRMSMRTHGLITGQKVVVEIFGPIVLSLVLMT